MLVIIQTEENSREVVCHKNPLYLPQNQPSDNCPWRKTITTNLNELWSENETLERELKIKNDQTCLSNHTQTRQIHHRTIQNNHCMTPAMVQWMECHMKLVGFRTFSGKARPPWHWQLQKKIYLTHPIGSLCLHELQPSNIYWLPVSINDSNKDYNNIDICDWVYWHNHMHNSLRIYPPSSVLVAIIKYLSQETILPWALHTALCTLFSIFASLQFHIDYPVAHYCKNTSAGTRELSLNIDL